MAPTSSALNSLLLIGLLAPQPLDDGVVLSEAVYSFPPFETAPGYVPGESVSKYWSEESYRAATEDPRFELRKIHYGSAGVDVVAYLYAPPGPAAQPLPTIVFNRGSFVVGDLAPVLAPLFHHLALRGYAVLAPLYRGSDGSDGVDEMGGEDLVDLLNVVPLAESLSVVDSANLFLVGESRGGMMTYMALREGFPARAAATYGALTDLGALMDSDPSYRDLAPRIWPDFEARKEEILSTRSALRWASELAVPLLILHGGADTSIDPAHSLRLALALQQAARTYELHVYAGDGHTLQQNKTDSLDRIADWFDRHRVGAGRD
jgi:dipeptidyl aminopeptidase/acylaminoacyl peptidase